MDLSHRVYISLSLSLSLFLFFFIFEQFSMSNGYASACITCLALVLSLQFNLIQCYSIYGLSNLQYHS